MCGLWIVIVQTARLNAAATITYLLAQTDRGKLGTIKGPLWGKNPPISSSFNGHKLPTLKSLSGDIDCISSQNVC